MNKAVGDLKIYSYLDAAIVMQNPYESPTTSGRESIIGHYGLRRRRLTRLLVLAIAGYLAYFGGLLLFAMGDSAIRVSDARLELGILVSIAFASSEAFFLRPFSLDESMLRRIGLSTLITIVSLVLAHGIARYVFPEESRYDPHVIPRLAIAAPIFILIAISVRYFSRHR